MDLLSNCYCRSAALAVAVLMLFGHSLEEILKSLAKERSFVLENEGFQKQLVQLEAMLQGSHHRKMPLSNGGEMYIYGTLPKELASQRATSSESLANGIVEVELLIPGLCTMDVQNTYSEYSG